MNCGKNDYYRLPHGDPVNFTWNCPSINVNPGTSCKSYLTPICSLITNFTGPYAPKILFVWWLTKKEVWPAGYNFDHLVGFTWKELVTTGNSWSHLAFTGHIWQQLVTPGNSWTHFATAGHSWSPLATAGHTLQQLVTPGNTWSYLATAGHTLKQLVTPGNSWLHLATAGHTWQQLVTAGHIYCAPSVNWSGLPQTFPSTFATVKLSSSTQEDGERKCVSHRWWRVVSR